jgi:hypothetical protein
MFFLNLRNKIDIGVTFYIIYDTFGSILDFDSREQNNVEWQQMRL